MSLSNEELAAIRERAENEPLDVSLANQHRDERDRAALLAEVERLRESAVAWTKVFPCETTHEPPYDFRQCETHDRTFPLDGKCDHSGLSEIDWLDKRETEQRFRAIQAEERAQTAQARLDKVRALCDAAPGGEYGEIRVEDVIQALDGSDQP